jgi:cytochrome c oxidase subunit 2
MARSAGTLIGAWLAFSNLGWAQGVPASGVPADHAQNRSMWTPPLDISVDGYRSDNLFILVTYMIVALFILMVAIMVAAAIKFRASSGAKAHYDRGDTKKEAVKALVISTLIFAAVDGTLLVKSHIDISEAYWVFPEGDPDVLRVQVLAQQWAWNFRYAGKDNKFNTADDIVTLNDFRVPENKRVLCQITSKDVIHSFFLANCRIKRDANPGEITRMWFATKPNTAGEFQVTCAEMCGYAHYLMQARFVVMKPADFDRWLDESAKWSSIAFDESNKAQQWGWEWLPKTPGQ